MSEVSNIRNYKDLLVWQEGMKLAKQIYVLTSSFPADEKFGLVAQMRRAAVSVPSNIAEGQARKTTGEFKQFLGIAQGSLAELDTQIILSVELSLATSNGIHEISNAITKLQKMMNALQSKLITTH
jgi:four helix bundle protein